MPSPVSVALVDHDRLFKELLTTFFAEFLELFLPQVHDYIASDNFEFLDKEVFTDVTVGDKHEADLVVKARFRDGDAFFLVHVENQSTAQADFGKRMFRYFARLAEAHDLPVYPVVLFSYDTPRRPEPAEYRVAFPDQTVLEFRYRVIQLNRLDWRDFLRHPNPVAAALMAKMRIAPRDRPHVKAECLRLLATLHLDPARAQLISGFIDSYLRLNTREQQQFEREVEAFAPPEKEATLELMTSWKQEGLAEGLAQGLERGEQREAKTLTLRQMRHRFGPLPEGLEARVAGLAKPELEELALALLDFGHLSDAEEWLDHHTVD
jgi:hypothetical protein